MTILLPIKLLLVWTLYYVCLVASQECEEKAIRITNENVTTKGNSYFIAGGLQICVNRQWGTVCQSRWSHGDAIVACRQLGLYYTGDFCHNSCYGNILTKMSYTRIRCLGNEDTLYECPRDTASSGCGNAAGVNCVAAKECEEKDLRMTGGIVTRNGDTYHISGGFEMCVDGLWTTICLQMWSDSSATVACRQLGLYYSGKLCLGSCMGRHQTSHVYLNFIRCRGSENTLYECNRVQNNSCVNAAGVYCALNRTSVAETSCDIVTERSSNLQSQAASISVQVMFGIISALIGVVITSVVFILTIICIKLRKRRLIPNTQQNNYSQSIDSKMDSIRMPLLESTENSGVISATHDAAVISSKKREDDDNSLTSNQCYDSVGNVTSSTNEDYSYVTITQK